MPMQETRVGTLVREDPICHGANKPVGHNYCACAIEPQLLKPVHPRAHAPQQEKLLQREALAQQLESSPMLAAAREKPVQQ